MSRERYITLQRRIAAGTTRRRRLLESARRAQDSLNTGMARLAKESLTFVLNEQRNAPDFSGHVPSNWRSLSAAITASESQWNAQQAEIRQLEELIRQALSSIAIGDNRYAWGKLNQLLGNMPGQRKRQAGRYTRRSR